MDDDRGDDYDAVATWAEGAGIAVARPARAAAPQALLDADPAAVAARDDASVDFGRMVVRVPRVILRPADIPQLAACMAELRRRRLPYKTRGSGHSSGGQTLLAGGAIIDLRGLARVVADAPERDAITVETGARWQIVLDALLPQGRRPVTLLDNQRVTVGGALAVGGFGDSTHLYGMQASSVLAATLVTPDGGSRRLEPDDELFRYALCGRGQLGVLAEVTVRTLRRGRRLRARRLRWPDLAAFLRDASTIVAHRLYEHLRARVVWPGGVVDAVAGNLDGAGDPDDALGRLRPGAAGDLEELDLPDALATGEAELDDWPFATPALELILPLPDGIATCRALGDRIVAGGLAAAMRGCALTLVPHDPRLPLAPHPGTPYALLMALRPRLTPAAARDALPALRAIGAEALDAGARVYLMSIEIDAPGALTRQLGPTLDRWRALRRELDPDDLCNPGLLP